MTPRAIGETPQRVQSLLERSDHFHTIRKQAQEAILHSQMLLSKDTQFQPYKEGEQVWLDARNLRTTHPTHKLHPKRYGLFTVTKVLSHVAYQLELPPTWKIHNVFHASYLSLFKETAEHGPNFLEPPPEIVEGEPEWEVERIIGMRYYGTKKIKQYRIRWKGYAPAQDTWEPIKNVHAPELVQQFLDEQRHGRDTSIRMARVGATKDDMNDPRESPFKIPDLQSTTNTSSRVLSKTSDPECATRLATETPSPKQKETRAAGAARANPRPGPAKPKRIQRLTPPSKPSTLPSNSLKGTSSNTSIPQPLGTPQPSTPLALGTTPPKIPSLNAAIAYELQNVPIKTTTYSTTASAKTPTAPRTTRTCPTTPSRWRPDLSLTLPNPSINNSFQNTPSPYLSRPSQRSSPSPWPTTTKEPEAVQTEARVRSWIAPRLLAIEEGMPPRRPPTPTPYANDLGPRVMDYTAGRPGALHHHPQPFDTEPLRQWDLPHIPPQEPPKENLPSLGFAPLRCYFCHDLRHAEKDCLEPHQRCKRDRRCVVPRRHPHFEQLCPFGAERGRWQTTAGRLRHVVSEHDVPSPDLRDILVEDAFDADSDYDREGGKCADHSPSPQGPAYPKDSLLLDPGTPSTTRPTEYWDNFELQTLNFQSPTPTSTPNHPPTGIQEDLYDPAWSGPNSPPITTDPWPQRNSPWSHRDDPYVPREWGGNGGLVADSVGADSYRGGNVTYPPTPASSTRQ